MDVKPVWDPKKVRRAVLKETLQHPLTLLFGSTSFITALYLALISGSKEGLLLALGAGGISLGSWIFNYFFRLDHFIQRYFDKWKKEVQKERDQRLAGLRKQLVQLQFKAGVQAYDDLISAYERYKEFLQENDLQTLSKFQRARMEGIAGETFDLGMRIISKLVSLVKVVKAVDVKRFRSEIQELDEQIERLRSREKESPETTKRIDNLLKRRVAIQTRIDSYQQALREIEGMLTQAEECENSIENSMLQMPVISDKISDQQLQKALAGMEHTVESARRISQRIEKLEANDTPGEHPDENLYLQAGRQK